MSVPIPFEDFIAVIRRVVSGIQAQPSTEGIFDALCTTGHSCVRNVLAGGCLIVCEGFGCYCPSRKPGMRCDFETLGKSIEYLDLRGGVLLASPPIPELLTDWSLRRELCSHHDLAWSSSASLRCRRIPRNKEESPAFGSVLQVIAYRVRSRIDEISSNDILQFLTHLKQSGIFFSTT